MDTSLDGLIATFISRNPREDEGDGDDESPEAPFYATSVMKDLILSDSDDDGYVESKLDELRVRVPCGKLEAVKDRYDDATRKKDSISPPGAGHLVAKQVQNGCPSSYTEAPVTEVPAVRRERQQRYLNGSDDEDSDCSSGEESVNNRDTRIVNHATRDDLSRSDSSFADRLSVRSVQGVELDFADTSAALPTGTSVEHRKWNEEFKNLLERPTATPEEAVERTQAIAVLGEEFVQAAVAIAKRIVREREPGVQQTITPATQVGGIAGGLKFIVGSMFFKIAINYPHDDGKHLYTHQHEDPNEGNEYSKKVAGHEVKSNNAIIGCHVDHLAVPLSCVIDYRGHRLTVQSVLPIHSTETLCYGSADAGKTPVRTSDALMNGLMHQLATKLNLRAHHVKNAPRKIFMPLDLEGHRGRDGRYYVIDTSRIMPPVHHARGSFQLGAGSKCQYLYQLMRPEFVSRHGVSLSSDAFSPFARDQNDEEKNERDIIDASRLLFVDVVPRAAEAIEQAVSERCGQANDPLGTISVNDTPHECSHDVDVAAVVHKVGLNVRYLGAVMLYLSRFGGSDCANRTIEIVATEICARVWRAVIECSMTRFILTDGSAAGDDVLVAGVPTSSPMVDSAYSEDYDVRWATVLARVANWIVDSNSQSDWFWNEHIALATWKRFGCFGELATTEWEHDLLPENPNPHCSSSVSCKYWPRSLRTLIDTKLLMRRVGEKLGVRWGSRLLSALTVQTRALSSLLPITANDIAEVGVTVKQTRVLPLADALRMMGRSEEMEDFYVKTVDIRRASVGDWGHETAIAHQHAAQLFVDQGELSRAHYHFLWALAIARKECGLSHDQEIHFQPLMELDDEEDSADVTISSALFQERHLAPPVVDTNSSTKFVRSCHFLISCWLAIGNAMSQFGFFRDAELVLRAAKDLRWRLCNRLHEANRLGSKEWVEATRDLAISLEKLARLERDRGNYRAAERHINRSLDLLHIATKAEIDLKTSDIGSIVSPLLKWQHFEVLANLQFLQQQFGFAETLYKQILAVFEKSPVIGPLHSMVAQVSEELSQVYTAKGQYREALNLLERSVEIKRQSLGKSHPRVAVAVRKLAQLLQQLDRHDEASELLADARDVLETRFARDHPEIIACNNQRAQLLQLRQQFDEAERVLLDSLRRIEIHGEFHPDVVPQLVLLADLYHKRARYSDESTMLERAQQIRGHSLDGSSIFALQSRSQLYVTQGKFQHALREQRRALMLAQRIHGLRHHKTAVVCLELGTVYQVCGQLSRAERYLRRCLQILSTVLEHGHLDFATAKARLAYVLTAKGDFQGSKILYKNAIAIGSAIRGEHHAEVAQMRTHLGWVYFRLGNLAKARDMYLRAKSDTENAFRDDGGESNHPAVARAINDLAELELELGNVTIADQLYRQALAMRKSIQGINSPDVAQSYRGIAMTELARSRYVDALHTLRMAMNIVAETSGDTHPKYATCLSDEAKIRVKQGDYSTASSLYERAIGIWSLSFGASSFHPDLANGRQNLGYVYSIRSEYDRACEQYTLAHRALSITFGPDHFTVAQVDASHGWLLLRRGLFDQALEKFREALQKRRKFFDIYLSRDQSIGEVLHPIIAVAHYELAEVLLRMGRFKEAHRHSYTALGIRANLFAGSIHVDIARCHDQLGQILVELGGAHYDEATTEFTLAKAAFEQIFCGKPHVKLADVYFHWARLLIKRGYYSWAEQQLGNARSIRQEALGDTHPEVASCDAEIARLLAHCGEFDAAADRYERAKRILHQSFLKDDDTSSHATISNQTSILHPQEALMSNHLAWVLCRRGLDKSAISRVGRLFEDAQTSLEKLLAKNHPDIARVMHDRAQFLWQIGERERAFQLVRDSMQIRQDVLGPDHLDFARSLQTLSRMRRDSQNAGAGTDATEDGDILHPSPATVENLIKSIRHVLQALSVVYQSVGEQHFRYAELLAELGRIAVVLDAFPDGRSLHALICSAPDDEIMYDNEPLLARLQKGQLEQMLHEARNIICDTLEAFHPESVSVIILEAEVHARLGRVGRALAVIQAQIAEYEETEAVSTSLRAQLARLSAAEARFVRSRVRQRLRITACIAGAAGFFGVGGFFVWRWFHR